MNFDNNEITTLEELARFLTLVEKGGLGLEGVEGIGMATSNADGRHFVAVFGAQHQLLLGRWVSKMVFEQGKDLVRDGIKPTGSKH